MLSHKNGFTLLEILLVVAAIAILAGIVIVAINPGKQLADTRNATRQTDVKTISDAVYQYSFDHGGAFPSGIDTNLRMLGTDPSSCAVNCGNTPSAVSYSATDNSAASFNAGSYSSTNFDNTSNWVQLTAGASAGAYTSNVKDAGDSATWSTFSWSSQFPTSKELPNNGGSEMGYASGNANMASNILLLHLNESSGANSFADASGSGNNAECGGIVCPTMGGSGKLNTAGYFDGLNNFIQVKSTSTLKFTGGSMSISIWVNPNIAETSVGIIISKPWNGNGKYNYWFEYYQGSATFCLGADKIFCGDFAHKITAGTWTHVVITMDSSKLKVFLNGVEDISREHGITSWMPSSGDNNTPLTIGTFYPYSFSWSGNTAHAFNGSIDELAMFNRPLSSAEISDIYTRGAARLKLQVRSCADSACAGQNFVGPDGAAGTFFTELSNTTLSPPSFSLSNVSANRYFQYKTTFETDNVSYSPELKSVSVAGTVANQSSDSSGSTLDACLDLTSLLASDYLTAIPVDPASGNAGKTYYALKKTANDRLIVMACNPENGKSISAKR